jgi:hypothetical protein
MAHIITFLTLPPELRPQILFNLISEPDLQRLSYVSRDQYDDVRRVRTETKHIEEVPEVDADLAYVREMWCKRLLERAHEQVEDFYEGLRGRIGRKKERHSRKITPGCQFMRDMLSAGDAIKAKLREIACLIALPSTSRTRCWKF